MKYESIADIYSANQRIRERFAATVSAIAPDEAVRKPEGEKWSIQQIAEHVAMVSQGTSRICAKLLEAARSGGALADGSLPVSVEFGARSVEIAGLKVEAPERVQPSGNVTIAEALAIMGETGKAFDSIRDDMERYDLSEPKFPHPYFGDITAVEWLIIAGGHEARHTKQIETLLEKVRQ